MSLKQLFESLRSDPAGLALITEGEELTRKGLLQLIVEARERLRDNRIEPGDVVVLSGDYSGWSAAFLIALIENGNIVFPAAVFAGNSWSNLEKIVSPKWKIDTMDDAPVVTVTGFSETRHPLYETLRHRQHAGLILMSSGSSGQPKAALHDFEVFLNRFDGPPRPVRTLAFMRFDHLGGIYNLFSCLYNVGTLCYSTDRRPDAIGAMIARHRLELMPTTASFFNLLLLSRPWQRYDFRSLKYVIYGTERVHTPSLEAMIKELPWVKFHQVYGLSEVGLLRSSTVENTSTWIKIADNQAQVRIRAGILEVKSPLTMLGYLGSDHSMTEDGWYITGDIAEERDGFIRVMGRQSEMIKVGGQAVLPGEIEDILIQMSEVVDLMVGQESNLLLGQIIVATVQVREGTDEIAFRQSLREHCLKFLEPYKVPAKIVVSTKPILGPRFKKQRAQ